MLYVNSVDFKNISLLSNFQLYIANRPIIITLVIIQNWRNSVRIYMHHNIWKNSYLPYGGNIWDKTFSAPLKLRKIFSDALAYLNGSRGENVWCLSGTYGNEFRNRRLRQQRQLQNHSVAIRNFWKNVVSKYP